MKVNENIGYLQAIEKEVERRHRNEISRNRYYKNKDDILEKAREERQTKKGRAKTLVNGYKYMDNEQGRGESTLTVEQLLSLWSEGCFWCGETDWRKLGADRIDNSKPHSLENCVCSCWDCNTKRGVKDFEYFKKIVK